MPNSGRYPCGNCNYVAASRRMLSRHTAIAHASQAFKCPLCPFVSCYQANLYRHKRDIHGLGRMTACEICGFFSSSIEDLIEHKENNHQDQIEWLKKKYANERVRLGVEAREEVDASADGESLLIKKEDEATEGDCRSTENNENAEDIPLEDQNGDEILNRINDTTTTTSSGMKSSQLGPIKIRRSYTCEECGLTTIDPREYLYHRRDDHGEKMTVHECKYCIYASRHVQKLQRHCALVHRQQMPVKKNTSNNSVAETTDTIKECSSATALKAADENVESWRCVATEELQLNNVTTESQPTARKVTSIKLFKCSECPFRARDNLRLIEHEKEVHRKKKDYECSQCGYDTDNKSRFTRHIKYHDIPKLKCSFCDFKTPYKWNMDRHLRNHVENGEYECNKCSFKTHAKQSLTVHLDYHHGNTAFNPKAKRPRLQTARKQRVIDHGQSNKLYLNNKALSNYIVDGEEENGDGDIDQIDDDDDTGSGDEDMVQRSLYLYQPSPEENMQKESYGNYKQHSCPLCDAKFNQLSSLGQHLKEGHPENDSASTIAAVVDMLSPQKHKIRESPNSTPLSGPAVTSKRSQFENKDKTVPTCKICGYKTRWVSELLKHERVHSGEKPFECNICEYKCKWKGDLTRHLQKFHKKEEEIMPKISGVVEEDNLLVVPNDNQICLENGSKNEDFCGLKPASFNDQDSPLDLTVTKKPTELVLLPALLGSTNKSVNNYHIPKEKPKFIPKPNFPVKQHHSEYEIVEPPSKIIKKYKCTFCGFMTRTASRFHVHMVQHFDKRPFVCSACGYRSNWQWDITKHIKMKSARDDSHMNATLIITDQTGEKNYEKYKSYLVDVEESRVVKKVRISHRVENKQFQCDAEKNDDKDDSSYIDVTSVMDEPENIIVTPDLPFSFEDPNQSRPALPSANEEFILEPYQSRPVFNNAVVNDPIFERYKLFRCKHCPYKHREKKVVVSHLAEHAGIKLFRCRVCGVSSNWKNVILRHVKTHHSGQLKYVEELITYTVEGHVVCLTGIKKQQNTDLTPIASPKKDATRRCSICPFTCLKENHFQFHMKQHQPREGTCFKCMFCPYYVKFRKTLIRHLELHKKESVVRNEPAQHAEEDNSDPAELFMKENCDNELPDNNHSQQDTPNMPYDEQVNRDNFYVKEKRHSCEQCPYKTDNKTQYLYHKQFHRPNKVAKFKCKLCSYWATHHHLIAQHQRVHNTEQKPLSFVDAQSSRFVQSSQESVDSQCVEEQLDYDENRQIKQIYVKRGEFYFRMFKCNYCPMMNKRRANVRVHEKMHAKSKVSKYTCPLCNYKCNNQGIITAHMKIHGNNSTPFTSGYNNDIATVGSTPVDTTQPPPLKRKRVFSYFCMRCPAVFKSTADLEIHKTFHTMSYPLPCPSCDYRAKNKACLHKHLLVHTPEYVAKREASYGPPVMPTVPETSYVIKSSEANQMLLLEEAEMKAVIEGNAIHSPQRLHRCTLCPVAFFKATTLQYHLSLHGSNGMYSCSHCNYAVDRNENLISHEKLHISPPKLVKPKAPVMFFSCPKCPAFFDKMNRYNRHLRLHGQKNKYTCEHCDYSVRLPANLFNHKIVHTKSYAERKQDLSFVSQETSAPGFSLSLESKNVEDLHKKRSFACDRCPYFYMRKDAVQRHQKRHSPEDGGEGLSCPYCDYSSLQLSFLRDHVRVHFQTESPYRAQAFMKHEEYEIWSVEDGKRDMLFKDVGVQKPDRFYPPLNKELEDLFAAEGETPSEFSSVEHHERDDIPNRKVPLANPVLFNENLEHLPLSQVHLELSSQQASSNSDEKSDLIEDALNQSKKLEVILTDVFYGGNKAVIMKAINNEAVVADQSNAQGILPEEISFVPQEQAVPSPKLVQLDDVNPETVNESELATTKECGGTENTTENSIQLDAPNTDAPTFSPPAIGTNTDVIEHDTSVLDGDYKMPDNNSFMSKEEVFVGTNSSDSFCAIENEKTIVRSNSDYFNTEFFSEEKPNIPNDAVIETQWKTEDTNLKDAVADGCDNVSDIQVNTTD